MRQLRITISGNLWLWLIVIFAPIGLKLLGILHWPWICIIIPLWAPTAICIIAQLVLMLANATVTIWHSDKIRRNK